MCVSLCDDGSHCTIDQSGIYIGSILNMNRFSTFISNRATYPITLPLLLATTRSQSVTCDYSSVFLQISTLMFTLTVPVKTHTCTFLEVSNFPVANRDGQSWWMY